MHNAASLYYTGVRVQVIRQSIGVLCIQHSCITGVLCIQPPLTALAQVNPSLFETTSSQTWPITIFYRKQKSCWIIYSTIIWLLIWLLQLQTNKLLHVETFYNMVGLVWFGFCLNNSASWSKPNQYVRGGAEHKLRWVGTFRMQIRGGVAQAPPTVASACWAHLSCL